MLAARITCPRCGTELTVTESGPPRVSCPVCLAALVNPTSPVSGIPRPVPVIPLDRQVERDSKQMTYLVFALGALLVLGAVATMARGGVRNGTFVVLLVGGLATVLYFMSAAKAGARPTPIEAIDPQDIAPSPPPIPATGGPATLHYDTRRRAPSTAATAGAVLAGFFSALGVCALGVYILTVTANNPGGRGSTSHHNAGYLAGVVVMVLLYIVASVLVSSRWRGFVPGSIAGLCLGMLALGPCAACYLLTIQ